MDYTSLGVKKGYITISENLGHVTYVIPKKTYVYSDPEEKVRASFYVELIEKYQYKPELIELEVTVPRRVPSDHADIVVFKELSHKVPFIVVECKNENISTPEERQAIEQAFGNANSLKAQYTSMVAGAIRTFYDIASFPAQERFKNIIADLPINFGAPQEWKYKKGDDKWELVNANTNLLMSLFNNCHDLIWQGGKKNPAEAFDEMSKLMFCKVRDERDCRNGSFYQFQIKTYEEPKSVAKRIRAIYSVAKNKDPDVFKTKIDLDDAIIYNVVLTLQSVSLARSDIDAKGRAFETFMGKIFRGELGQFFTPREIVKFMVHMLEPTSEDVIIDPSCGSGGFLLNSLDYVREELYQNLNDKEAYRAEVDFVRYNLYGIEVNHQIGRVAMMDMILHDDGHTNIELGDGLDDFDSYDPKREIKEGKYSIVLQNPPFGFTIKRDTNKYVKEYELAEGKDQISSQILFIERAFKLLKPGGKMGIVVPDSITTNSTTQYVRNYIMKRFQIIGVVSLPKETFMPSGTGVKTSILFLQKKTAAQIAKEELELSKLIKQLNKTNKEVLKKLLGSIDQTTKAGAGKAKKAMELFIAQTKASAEQQALKNNSYPVFMAVAKYVGYDATGKPEKNDLYEVDASGKIIRDKGILGEFKRFKNDPVHYKFSDVLKLIGVKDE